MEFSVKSGSPEGQRSVCIVVGVLEPRHLSPITEQPDKVNDGHISALLHRGELEGKSGQTLLLYHVPNVSSERILLIGCGKGRELDERQYKQVIQKTINTLSDIDSVEAVCFLTELHVKSRNNYWKVRQAVETAKEVLYSSDQLKTNRNGSRHSLRKVVFSIPTRRELASGEHAVRHGLAVVAGIKAAKDLGDIPPNICNIVYPASQTRQLADSYSKSIITCVIGEQQVKELRMHSHLAVDQGSQDESLMSVIGYKGNAPEDACPIMLVGEGLIFDSGDILIKSSEGMDEMKYDMCGVAAVYGVVRMIVELQPPTNATGVLVGCENMPDGHAYRPGDVLTTMSGQTVEVLNTDAEDCLALCDVLTHVERSEPEAMVDVMMLTGACVIALGRHITDLVASHNSLTREPITASEQSDGHAWRLPLGDRYQEQLKPNSADMVNIGGRPGGVTTVGCFLSRFIHKYNWAYLDITGITQRSGKARGATGRPVMLLVQFLLNHAGFNGEK